jgi:hypothetical protein
MAHDARASDRADGNAEPAAMYYVKSLIKQPPGGTLHSDSHSATAAAPVTP